MNWNNDLNAAGSQDAVLSIVNEFLAEQDERFWAGIAPDARPEAVDSAADVHRWHHELVQELKRQKPATLELQELCVLFLRASVRLHQIELRDPDGGTPSNDAMGCASATRKARWVT